MYVYVCAYVRICIYLYVYIRIYIPLVSVGIWLKAGIYELTGDRYFDILQLYIRVNSTLISVCVCVRSWDRNPMFRDAKRWYWKTIDHFFTVSNYISRFSRGWTEDATNNWCLNPNHPESKKIQQARLQNEMKHVEILAVSGSVL